MQQSKRGVIYMAYFVPYPQENETVETHSEPHFDPRRVCACIHRRGALSRRQNFSVPRYTVRDTPDRRGHTYTKGCTYTNCVMLFGFLVSDLISRFNPKRAKERPDARIVRGESRLDGYAFARRHAALTRHQRKRLQLGNCVIIIIIVCVLCVVYCA